MKKLFFGIFVCLCALIITSCSNNTPSGKAKAYLDNLKDANYAELIDQCHFKKAMTDDDKAKLVVMLEDKGQKSIEKDGAIESYEITGETISEDGTTAKVEYTLKYAEGKEKAETLKMINMDGEWFVDSGK